jgi:hypothetical protein
VIRSCSAVLLASLLIGAFGHAQDASGSPRLRLFLPPSVPSDRVEIRYTLYGAFGAYGSFVIAKPDSASVEIPLSVSGQVAGEIKAFAWAPGCHVARFSIKVGELDLHESYSCEPLPFVLLKGQVEQSPLLHQRPAEVQVEYLASWACDFFELDDCMVPQFSVGISRIDSAGRFEINLPDFAADPSCKASRASATFEVTLREVKTYNPIASLSPRSKTVRILNGALKPASVYLNPTMFIAGKPQ